MAFSFDWFSHNIGNWNKWLEKFKGKPIHALEIGCYEGKATCWLLENILTHPESTITVIDTFQGSDEHTEFGVSFSNVLVNFCENTKAWTNKIRIVKGKSSEVSRHLTEKFSIVYVDGSHRAPDVLTDGCLSWPMIEIGGILIFDDYGWDHYPDKTMNPRLGVDSFLSTFEGCYNLLAKEYQVAVEKIR